MPSGRALGYFVVCIHSGSGNVYPIWSSGKGQLTSGRINTSSCQVSLITCVLDITCVLEYYRHQLPVPTLFHVLTSGVIRLCVTLITLYAMFMVPVLVCTPVIGTPHFASVGCAACVLRPVQRCTWGNKHG